MSALCKTQNTEKKCCGRARVSGEQNHYGVKNLRHVIERNLAEAGLSAGHTSWRELAPLDQFHVRGLAATEELAAQMAVGKGDKVVDIGSGLGGPSRYLAATYGCQITGVDLSEQFVDVARYLAVFVGLGAAVDYKAANALALPFSDRSFDHAWTQHVAMNIADRAGLYGEIYRVMKPGGRFGIYDVVLGDGGIIYPVPWAPNAQTSHLVTPETMADVLGAVGFETVSWTDTTAEGIAWSETVRQAPRSRLNLGLAMGEGFAAMSANLARNLREGRVRLLQAVMRRPVE